MRLLLSITLVLVLSPSAGAQPEGISFRSVVRQYSPIEGKSAVFWLQHFVSSTENTFRIVWHEPHWLTVRFPTYPVSLEASFSGTKSSFRNAVQQTDMTFVTIGPRPPHSNRFTYDYTDLRYSHLELQSAVKQVRDRTRLTGTGTSLDLVMKKEVNAHPLARYRQKDAGEIESMFAHIPPQSVKYRPKTPRLESRLETVNGKSKAVIARIEEEEVPFCSGGRDVSIQFARKLDRDLPLWIAVKNHQSGATLFEARMEGYERSQELAESVDFLPDSDYLRWVRFAVATNIRDRVLSEEQESQANAYLTKFRRRLDSPSGPAEALRISRAVVVALFRKHADAESFSSPVDQHFEQLLNSGFPLQVLWNAIELQSLAVFKDRTDMLAVVRRSLSATLKGLVAKVDRDKLVRESLILAKDCRLGEEWFTLAILRDLSQYHFSDEHIALILACRSGLLHRAMQGDGSGAYVEVGSVSGEYDKVTAEFESAIRRIPEPKKAEFIRLRKAIEGAVE